MKSKPVLTQEDCAKITAACQAEARKNKWNVTIAIVDDGGHLLSLTRMDGTAPVSRRSTKVSEERIGVSGVQSHEDEQVCNAGIAALS